jgi:hypothetical protein
MKHILLSILSVMKYLKSITAPANKTGKEK